MEHFNIAVIAGDGVGPEVIEEGKKVFSGISRIDGNFSVSFYTGSVFFHIDSAIFKVSTEKTAIFTENCNHSVDNSISCNIFSFYKSFRLKAFRGNLQTFHKS